MAEARTAGRYELQEELGRGAMGIVYKAYDPRIGRPVAVKTMRLTEVGTGMKHEELVARFDIETKAAGRLTHPNIVVIYDAGEDSGVFYITMELVTGRSLQSLVDSKQVFPLPRVMRIMEQAGAALDFAHQNSVVHRDIKPANLLLTADDTVKVTDFGTAKILQKGATQTGAILGTPSYMSPEQVKGKPVDGRSDIFSLGVILYELVTGEKPFPGQNVTTVIYKIVNEEPIPPREIDNSVHTGLSYVIMRALSKEPDLRYQSCKELVEDLKNYKTLGGGTDSATVVMPGRQRPKEVEEAIARMAATTQAAAPVAPKAEPTPPRPPAPRPVTLPPLTGALQRPAEEPPSRTGLWVTISILLLAVLGGGGYLLWPELQQNFNKGRQQLAKQSQTAAAESQPAAAPPADATTQPAEESTPASNEPVKHEPAAKAVTEEPAKELSPQEKLEADIQSRLAAAGFGNRVRADIQGRNLVLSGTLAPHEARAAPTVPAAAGTAAAGGPHPDCPRVHPYGERTGPSGGKAQARAGPGRAGSDYGPARGHGGLARAGRESLPSAEDAKPLRQPRARALHDGNHPGRIPSSEEHCEHHRRQHHRKGDCPAADGRRPNRGQQPAAG